eukprot:3659795-Rhodomonas_salina.1
MSAHPRMQLHGAAYGAGIYLSLLSSVSLAYSGTLPPASFPASPTNSIGLATLLKSAPRSAVTCGAWGCDGEGGGGAGVGAAAKRLQLGAQGTDPEGADSEGEGAYGCLAVCQVRPA